MASKTVSSDFNLQRINTKEYEDLLKGTIEFGGNIFTAALRGSGKTQIAKDTIKQMGLEEVYLNLSIIDRVDLSGYPELFNAEKRYVDYKMPYFFKKLIEGDKKVVMLLDEVDKCDASLQAPLLELTQFHTMNGLPLPNLQACIMTGNLVSEGGSRPSLPLLDRSFKYLLEASSVHWLDWAGRTKSIHPSITAYIYDNADDLFGDVDPGDVYADPSPRGWHNASKIVEFGEEKRWSGKMLTTKVSGCVGKKAGIKYSAYFDHYVTLLPIVEQIIKGEKIKKFNDLERSKQIVTCFIVCARLAGALDAQKAKGKKEKDFPVMTKNIGNFLSDVDPEMALVSVRGQIGAVRCVENGLDEHPVFSDLLTQIAKRIDGT